MSWPSWRSNPTSSSFSQRPRDRPTTRSAISIDSDDEEMTPPTFTDYKNIPTWITHYKKMVEQETFQKPIQALQEKYGGKRVDHGQNRHIYMYAFSVNNLHLTHEVDFICLLTLVDVM